MTGPVRSGRKPGTRAGIRWDAQPLGRMTDNALARRLGVSFGTVQKRRVQRGIARFDRSVVARAANWLGKESDRAIARRLGCSESNVTAYRISRGIACLHPKMARLLGTAAKVMCVALDHAKLTRRLTDGDDALPGFRLA